MKKMLVMILALVLSLSLLPMSILAAESETAGDCVDRAAVVTELWQLEEQPVVNYLIQFEDVPAETAYTEAVRWAAAEGIACGYSVTAFGPDDAVTREQFATILWSYAKYKELDVSVGENTNILSYEDAFDISEWAIPAMQWACGAGLMGGEEAFLVPAGTMTREQMSAMLARFNEFYN